VGSTRAGVGARGEFAAPGAADVIDAAASLRWVRPDLAAALADHVLDSASAAGEKDRWLAAAGWAVHARSATGDGRETASEVMEALPRWGRAPLAGPAAARLRVELAMVAAGAGEVETARQLIAPVAADDGVPELRADLMCALARCAVEDAPERVGDALRNAEAAWSAVEGPAGEIGGASVALISAVVQRRSRRADAAVEHAADGLARLERGRGAGSGTPSGHLAAALAAEWISALLDAGRVSEARDGCVPLMPRLTEPTRPSRQLALLRLTVARAVATGDAAEITVELLEQAAKDAAGSDVPELESVCRAALGALHENAGRLDTALESLRLGVVAERRDRTRMLRFRTALAELPPETVRAGGSAERSAPTRVPRGTAAGGDSSTTMTMSAAPGGRRAAGRDSAPRTAQEPAAAASSGTSEFEELLRIAERPGRRPERRAAAAEAGSSGGGRRRRDDDSTEGSLRRSRSAERARSEQDAAPDGASGRTAPGGNVQETPGDDPAAGWGAVPWDEFAGDSPIGDLLIRSLRGGASPREDRNGADGRNGNGRSGRRERGEAATSRNGGSRSDEGTKHAGPGSEQRSHSAERSENGRGSEDRPERRSRSEGRAGSDNGSASESWALTDDRHGSERPPRSAERGRSAGGARRRSGSADRAEDSWSFDERADAGENGRGAASTLGEDVLERGRERARTSDAGRSGGRKHGADDPWATGQWPVRPGGNAEGADDRGGDSAGHPTELIPAATSSTTGADPESWLRAALADLDRVWGSPPRDEAPATSTTDPGRGDDGTCVVVIDVARDGRRFAGRRAAAVARAVADRLTDRLPRGARLRFGDSDALSITLPAWDCAAATEWMHRTLPGLLEGFVPDDALPAAQLRAAVHDADGPVGAQILQSLEPVPGRRRDAASPGSDTVAGSRSGRRRAGEDRGARPEWETAPDSDPVGWPWGAASARGSGRGEGSEVLRGSSGSGPTHAGGSPANGAAGRHEAERSSTRTDGVEAGGGGRRHRRGSDASAQHDDRYRADLGGESDPEDRSRGGRNGGRAERPGGDAGRARSNTGDTGRAAPISGDAARAERASARAARNSSDGGPAAANAADTGPAEPDRADSDPERQGSESTEGLGLADLLAGALAAYRGI
jgi:hypothetical protein